MNRKKEYKMYFLIIVPIIVFISPFLYNLYRSSQEVPFNEVMLEKISTRVMDTVTLYDIRSDREMKYELNEEQTEEFYQEIATAGQSDFSTWETTLRPSRSNEIPERYLAIIDFQNGDSVTIHYSDKELIVENEDYYTMNAVNPLVQLIGDVEGNEN